MLPLVIAVTQYVALVIVYPKGERLILPIHTLLTPYAAIAAHALLRDDPDALMLVAPADHDIPDEEAFCRAVGVGVPAAEAGRLVVFGVEALAPETGYGYVERGAPFPEASGCYHVASFVEKPELEIARRLIASGRHHWNSGIFLFRASNYLNELQRFRPDIHEACERAIASANRMIDLNPNSGVSYGVSAIVLAHCGDPEVALDLLGHARRMAPQAPFMFNYLTGGAVALYRLGRFREAADMAESAGLRRPNYFQPPLMLAAALVNVDETERAIAAMAAAHRIVPSMTVAWLRPLIPLREETDFAQLVSDLRSAGWNA